MNVNIKKSRCMRVFFAGLLTFGRTKVILDDYGFDDAV